MAAAEVRSISPAIANTFVGGSLSLSQ